MTKSEIKSLIYSATSFLLFAISCYLIIEINNIKLNTFLFCATFPAGMIIGAIGVVYGRKDKEDKDFDKIALLAFWTALFNFIAFILIISLAITGIILQKIM